MHLHEWRRLHKSMPRIGIKKRLRRQNAPEAQRQAKKERDIRPRYCTAPSRVFSNK